MTKLQQTFPTTPKTQKRILSGMFVAVNNMKKSLVFTICLLIFCTLYGNIGYAIVYSDLSSKSWGLIDKSEAAQIFADELTKNDLYVRIDLSSVIYKDKGSSVGLSSEECSSSKLKHDVILRFGNYDGITSQKYTFDSSKVYFIKGNKKYYLSPNKKGVFNLSENFSKDKNTKNPLYRSRNYPLGVNIYAFSSPLICKQLDNAILVIGGIFINGVETKPIKIRITYTSNKGK